MLSVPQLTGLPPTHNISIFGVFPLSKAQQDAIVVRGAKVHNLKNITVRIPLNSLSVVTGVSGSGKSSLAFDTLYAEGQRRYIASLSAYARQFLERIDRPDVDEIEGICPALAIRQKNYVRNPRSTVGTVTEINDYLRLLYARIGTTHCYSCGRIVEKDTPGKIADFILSLPQGQRFYLCIRLDLDEPEQSRSAPRSRRSKRTPPNGSRPEDRLAVMLPGLERQGFVRLLIDNDLVDLPQSVEALRKSQTGEAHIVVDRLVVRENIRERLVDSIEVCSRESEGHIELILLSDNPDETERMLERKHPQIRWLRHPAGTLIKFSDAFECQLCGIRYRKPEPRLFSFNNPFGACPECQGFGNTMTLDFDLVIPDKSKSLAEGAVAPWSKPRYRNLQNRLLQFASRETIPVNEPWNELAEAQREKIINGHKGFPGILGFFEYLERKKYKMHVRIFISRYRGYAPCLACHGERLRSEARCVLLGGKPITEIMRMTIRNAAVFFAGLELTSEQKAIAERILSEINHRLDLLVRVGLGYIALDRLSSSLSGGESQRIQLATALGSTLVGALYVLDEPSIGLHPRDSRRLIDILQSLKSLGNTVLVVEHDAEIMKSADHIVDLGPRAGELGGEVVYQGDYASLAKNPASLTGKYLGRKLKIPVPVFRRKRKKGKQIELFNARKHNLKNLDIRIPLSLLVCITGVSGSGKSTLVHDVLYAAVKKAKGELKESPDGFDAIRGAERITDVILVDQSPIGKTPRSNPATYTKAFDDIRKIFAGTRDAYSRGFGPGHFSFNLAAGRCETCQGNGTVTVEMQFLADVELTCEDCKGRRFKSSVLEVSYKGRNIAEVLDLTVREAIDFFAGNAGLLRKLRLLEEIGLGYLRLGQSATSLSGGEAQRIKLATYISRAGAKNTLFIFDEPTTGLHFDDIRKLLAAFDKLLGAGNSLVVIEHNLDVIKTADWIIDLGPEGGEEGGQIVFEGTPEELVECEKSHTARALEAYL
ncbi:MAG: excinuclease ABC subunit UvrA [Acidobacteria bacterium]|nr:excinuclease ABC subunit UvrA [Acidobacteriota bacterium]